MLDLVVGIRVKVRVKMRQLTEPTTNSKALQDRILCCLQGLTTNKITKDRQVQVRVRVLVSLSRILHKVKVPILHHKIV